MTFPLVSGLLLGLGLWCVVRAFSVPTKPLTTSLEALAQPRWSANDDTAAGDTLTTKAQRVGRWIMDVTGTDMSGLRADLAVVGRSEEHHLFERLRTALFWACLPPVFWILPVLSTGSEWFSPVMAAASSVVFGVIGWFQTDSQVRSRARARRREFDSTLVTYLGLVSILMAGGAGTNQALQDAVDQGDRWAFQLLARCLTNARVRGISPWDSMAEEGERLDIESLEDLAATMELAGTSGAHIRESLMTKAKSLRTHQISEVEREASGRTTAMAGPTGLMMTGFVFLLLYPAVQAVLGI